MAFIPDDQAVIFRRDRRKLIGLSFIGIAFVAMGAFLILHAEILAEHPIPA